MKNLSFGIVNEMIRNKYNDVNYLNENASDISKYFDIVKNSSILSTEFKVFNNLNNASIKNQMSASRYIDNNILLFEIYTIDEIESEREKLKPFITENKVNNIELFNAIDTLIEESLKYHENMDINAQQEAYEYVLNHINENTKREVQELTEININEDILRIAVRKFNQKYSNLNENDKFILNKLINSSYQDKSELFEDLKNDTISILNEGIEGLDKEDVNNAINKIKNIKINEGNINDEIIELHELKRELI